MGIIWQQSLSVSCRYKASPSDHPFGDHQTNARIGSYAGLEDAWNRTTSAGGTIHAALDFAIAQPAGEEPLSEIHPYVAVVGSIYGDPNGKYAAFLKSQDASYPAEAYFLWDQPLSDSGLVRVTSDKGASASVSEAARPAATSADKNSAGLMALPCIKVAVFVSALFGAFLG